ncbi:hypothetical protein CL633_00135 [bacterium]|nr:hypothetical protein [bacterium]|tara:strand:+ start:1251 stop:1640 length:390 start_codon:yes stop_codon:yes gene_type:complete
MAILKFAKIPKLHFSFLILLPLAIIIETFQHKFKVGDSINQFILYRSTFILLYLIIGFIVLSFLKNYISTECMFWALIGWILILLVILTILIFFKPPGQHWEWKHVVDVISWTSGPLILYPLVEKFLLK